MQTQKATASQPKCSTLNAINEFFTFNTPSECVRTVRTLTETFLRNAEKEGINKDDIKHIIFMLNHQLEFLLEMKEELDMYNLLTAKS